MIPMPGFFLRIPVLPSGIISTIFSRLSTREPSAMFQSTRSANNGAIQSLLHRHPLRSFFRAGIRTRSRFYYKQGSLSPATIPWATRRPCVASRTRMNCTKSFAYAVLTLLRALRFLHFGAFLFTILYLRVGLPHSGLRPQHPSFPIPVRPELYYVAHLYYSSFSSSPK